MSLSSPSGYNGDTTSGLSGLSPLSDISSAANTPNFTPVSQPFHVATPSSFIITPDSNDNNDNTPNLFSPDTPRETRGRNTRIGLCLFGNDDDVDGDSDGGDGDGDNSRVLEGVDISVIDIDSSGFSNDTPPPFIHTGSDCNNSLSSLRGNASMLGYSKDTVYSSGGDGEIGSDELLSGTLSDVNDEFRSFDASPEQRGGSGI
jgi:hypothetical protein